MKILMVITAVASLCLSVKADDRSNLTILAYFSVIPVEVNKGRALLDAQVYLKNVGNIDEVVVTGDLVKISWSIESIAFSVTIDRTPDGELVKPSPLHIDMVVLKPGELVKLGAARIPIFKEDRFERDIIYTVSEDVSAFYNVWTGCLESTRKMNRAGQPKHGEGQRAKEE